MNDFTPLKMLPTTITYDAEKSQDYRYWQEYLAILKNMSLSEMHLLRVSTDRDDGETFKNLLMGRFIYNRAVRGDA